MIVDKNSEKMFSRGNAAGRQQETGLAESIRELEKDWRRKGNFSCACGSKMLLPSGSCFVCPTCGQSSGCG